MTQTKMTRRVFQALALAGFAAAGSVPARAAVIQISSTAERSPEYAVSDTGPARLVGTITGSVGPAGGGPLTPPLAETTLLSRIYLDVAQETRDRVFSLAPLTVPVASLGRLSIPVDIAFDITGVTGLGVVPDLLFERGTFPFTGSYVSYLWFDGTLSTGADATASFADAGSAQNVPEPAAWAMLGVGLLGLAFARRRAA